jgi:hypothetical protein
MGQVAAVAERHGLGLLAGTGHARTTPTDVRL